MSDDLHPCAYCGTPTKGHREHVEPKVAGGSNLAVNIAHACASCNLEKGDRDLETWAADRVRVDLSWPPMGSIEFRDGMASVLTDDEMDLVNPVISHLGDTVSGLYRAARRSTAFTFETAAQELVAAAKKVRQPA